MVPLILIFSRHSRRNVLHPAIPLPPCPPSPQSANFTNSFPFTSIADPHPLSPVESYRFKNIGWRERALPSNFQLSTSSIHPFYFLHLTHSFPQRALHNSPAINMLRTLSIATGVYPPVIPSKEEKHPYKGLNQVQPSPYTAPITSQSAACGAQPAGILPLVATHLFMPRSAKAMASSTVLETRRSRASRER